MYAQIVEFYNATHFTGDYSYHAEAEMEDFFRGMFPDVLSYIRIMPILRHVIKKGHQELEGLACELFPYLEKMNRTASRHKELIDFYDQICESQFADTTREAYIRGFAAYLNSHVVNSSEFYDMLGAIERRNHVPDMSVFLAEIGRNQPTMPRVLRLEDGACTLVWNSASEEMINCFFRESNVKATSLALREPFFCQRPVSEAYIGYLKRNFSIFYIDSIDDHENLHINEMKLYFLIEHGIHVEEITFSDHGCMDESTSRSAEQIALNHRIMSHLKDSEGIYTLFLYALYMHRYEHRALYHALLESARLWLPPDDFRGLMMEYRT